MFNLPVAESRLYDTHLRLVVFLEQRSYPVEMDPTILSEKRRTAKDYLDALSLRNGSSRNIPFTNYLFLSPQRLRFISSGENLIPEMIDFKTIEQFAQELR